MRRSDHIYYLIDYVPELPYFILSLLFIFSHDVPTSRHVLAMLFIYVSLALAIGILVKCASKSARPKERYKLSVICYDVPSLHTLISAGLVFFAFFINPLYVLLLIPLAVLYMHSRVTLGFHTRKAVVVGALIGALVGSVTGFMLWKIRMSVFAEEVLVILVLITPLVATLLRIVNYRRTHTGR